MKYYALFDEQGNRVTTYIEGIHETIPREAIAITEEEQNLYATNQYIRGEDGKPVKRPAYVPTLEKLKASKLVEMSNAAASAYVSGFYSAASGVKLYYDSEIEDQNLISGVYARTKEPDWKTKERYPGVAPAGKAPIRARPRKDSLTADKTVQLLDAEELKVLVDDLDSHLYTVKAMHWQLQAAVAVAETAEEIDAIKWPE